MPLLRLLRLPSRPADAPSAAAAAADAADQALPLRLLLAFASAPFERRFTAHYVAFYDRYAQAALVLGLLLVLGDCLVDGLVHPGMAANWLRLQVAAPILGVGLAFTLLPQARRHWQPALAGFIVAVAFCLFWILLKIDAEGGNGLSSWVGILNFTFIEFYCFVILGVQFRVALIAGGLILAAFETALWWRADLSGAQIAYWTYHVVTLFILAAGVGWWREYVLRKDFAVQAALDEARQAAERLAQAKSAFLATMSHEIRTPLNGVLGMNELLIGSALSPEQRAWTEGVQASGRHLLALINDVLDVSRIEAGRLTLEAVDLDLRQVVEEARLMFAQPALAKGLDLQAVFMPADGHFGVRGDPLRLRQVVANLIGNAIKFTEVGSVRVQTELLASEAGTARLRISVRDTGVGIAPEAQARIFEQFAQADGSTTRRYGGSGLGLAICRELTALMGGGISVHSAAGEGACFVVDLQLPLADAGAAPAAAADNTPQRLRGRVLLVEDHPANQRVAIGMLRRLGLQWQLAVDGAEAVEKVRAETFDLVLMDCQMPVMDGYAATAAIRAMSGGRGAALPIVALTANASADDAARCRAAGMDEVLPKPFSLAALGTALARRLPAADPADPAADLPAGPDDGMPTARPARGAAADATQRATAAAAAWAGSIDAGVIDTLIGLDENGRPDLLREVFDGFLHSADQRLAQVQAAVEAQQAPVLRRAAHALKSGAANVGALALSHHYGELERCAQDGQVQRAGTWLVQARHEQARVKAGLQHILAALA